MIGLPFYWKIRKLEINFARYIRRIERYRDEDNYFFDRSFFKSRGGSRAKFTRAWWYEKKVNGEAPRNISPGARRVEIFATFAFFLFLMPNRKYIHSFALDHLTLPSMLYSFLFPIPAARSDPKDTEKDIPESQQDMLRVYSSLQDLSHLATISSILALKASAC